MRIHHIGYLVKDIRKAQEDFINLGYSIEQEVLFDEYRGINISFLKKDGYCIELVASASNDSVVAGLSKKIKNSPYHICYESESFDEDIRKMTQNGEYLQIDRPMIAPALNNKRAVFLVNPNIGIIEIVENA